MKTKIFLLSTLLATSITFGSCNNNTKTSPVAIDQNPETEILAVSENKIQLAILLDTSGSMSGLIDQAKSRLWNIVNTLTSLKYNGETPDIEIALYEYGNDGLSKESNYFRQISPLSTDLDVISENLFALQTNGGSEYCGAVIKDAIQKLEWTTDSSNMKLIYIAGNEPFNQGGVEYIEATKIAVRNNIYVNTIFCGNKEEGIRTLWQDGAVSGHGKYFNIDSNQSIKYIATPYDDEIAQCNSKINRTYVSYGKSGNRKKQLQMQQDANASSMSASNYIERSVSKSKKVYKNDSWDLVDKMKENENIVEELNEEELPTELKGKSKTEIKTYVIQKKKEREVIQKKIKELAVKRQQFIDNKSKEENKQDDLGNAINSSIVSLGLSKGYTLQ